MGYHRAGFEVVGVDIKPQKHYPFEFHQADAMTYPLDGFDVIHASPPCQAFTVYRNNGNVGQYPDLIEPIRKRLKGMVFVLENVPGAPVSGITLCGTFFKELEVRRHRLFESSRFLFAPICSHGALRALKYPGSSNRPNGRTVCNVGEWRVPFEQQKRAMGIDWMSLEELSEAIPPAYTEFIGKQIIQQT